MSEKGLTRFSLTRWSSYGYLPPVAAILSPQLGAGSGLPESPYRRIAPRFNTAQFQPFSSSNWYFNLQIQAMAPLSQDELDGIYAFAVDLGKRAGEMLVDAAQVRIDGGDATQEEKEHVQKENAVDLVTETDESMLPSVCPITLKCPPQSHAIYQGCL